MAKRPFDRAAFQKRGRPGHGRANLCEPESVRPDFKRGDGAKRLSARNKPNVFFGAEKRYFGVKFDVFLFNTSCLIVSTLGLLGLLHWILRRELEVRRSQISCVGRAFRLSSDGFWQPTRLPRNANRRNKRE